MFEKIPIEVPINCTTEKELTALLTEFQRLGVNWANGEKALDYFPFWEFEDNTCIMVRLHNEKALYLVYDSIDEFLSLQYNVISFRGVKHEI